MVNKGDWGAEWFISQGVYSAGPVVKLLTDYGALCRARGIVPKKVGTVIPAPGSWGLLSRDPPFKRDVLIYELCILQVIITFAPCGRAKTMVSILPSFYNDIFRPLRLTFALSCYLVPAPIPLDLHQVVGYDGASRGGAAHTWCGEPCAGVSETAGRSACRDSGGE